MNSNLGLPSESLIFLLCYSKPPRQLEGQHNTWQALKKCYLQVTRLEAELQLVSDEGGIQNPQGESQVLHTADSMAPRTCNPIQYPRAPLSDGQKRGAGLCCRRRCSACQSGSCLGFLKPQRNWNASMLQRSPPQPSSNVPDSPTPGKRSTIGLFCKSGLEKM